MPVNFSALINAARLGQPGMLRLHKFDKCFSSFDRRNDFRQFRVETAEQLDPARIPESDPHDGRTLMQEDVDGKILVLRDDHRTRFCSLRTNPRIRRLLQSEISDMFGLVATRLDEARERRRELSVDEKAQSYAPQDGVIVLLGRELQDRGDVLGFKVGIIRQDLFSRGAGGEQLEHVLHADTKTSNAGTAPAHVGIHGDSVERAHPRIVARRDLTNAAQRLTGQEPPCPTPSPKCLQDQGGFTRTPVHARGRSSYV
jgi:hypothetical protein